MIADAPEQDLDAHVHASDAHGIQRGTCHVVTGAEGHEVLEFGAEFGTAAQKGGREDVEKGRLAVEGPPARDLELVDAFISIICMCIDMLSNVLSMK